ncbi:PAS domain-containing sensor histidine kinase [Megalodesulfovibrio gigas]|uniref:histidine kinase n=1 Tax=Megalodesulfovibrio gigas (strain ATCC 19364 / DSM 1382 / NCIMB 9332 / VKM B-1759) TaxID=1121448 RepID=T2GCJ7_MEGG1|nr:PAS domain-containing sensor histidine kinase [Megalodesulfovibrio gigas]AGW13612.1 putative two-component sensor histidine kinase [Megalodesulfovibrio gigas DSM 1382 = ATCC 19364]
MLDATLSATLGPIYDALPVGVILADDADDVVFVNREFHRVTEVTPRDLEFMGFQDVLSLFCLGMCAAMPDICCPKNKWLNVERSIARADGSTGWVRIHCATVTVDGQTLQQLIVEDVTKYRDCIDGLLNRKKKYQSILEKRPDPICCFLPDFSITYANASCCRCFGRRRNECVGENLLLALPPAVREGFHSAVASISPEHPVAEVEQRLEDAGSLGPLEDRPMWIRWVVQGFFYKTGHIREYQAVGMDISDQKLAESRVLHADRLLSLGALVSEVAHEINNPNNFIMLNAPLLMDLWWRLQPALERLREEDVEPAMGDVGIPEIVDFVPRLLQGVVEGSTRINRIVKELKQYSRQDVDGGFELLGINEVVQAAALLMHKNIGRRTRRFDVRYGTGLPLVRGRRQRLEQVVVNLLQNACHALEHEGQGIVVETRRNVEAGAVEIVVTDEGVGIPPEALPLVTQPFYSTKGSQGGTGLGLSISLSIAREHGGRLELESTPGLGTRAVLALPEALPGSGAINAPSTMQDKRS